MPGTQPHPKYPSLVVNMVWYPDHSDLGPLEGTELSVLEQVHFPGKYCCDVLLSGSSCLDVEKRDPLTFQMTEAR